MSRDLAHEHTGSSNHSVSTPRAWIQRSSHAFGGLALNGQHHSGYTHSLSVWVCIDSLHIFL